MSDSPTARMIKRASLKVRILLLFSLFMVLAVWLIGERVAELFSAELEASARHDLEIVAAAIATDIEGELALRLDALNSIARTMTAEIVADPERSLRRLSEHPFAALLFSEGLVVANKDLRIVADHPPIPGRRGASLRDRAYVRPLLNGHVFAFGRPQIGSFTQRPTVVLALPLGGGVGSGYGILLGVMSLTDQRIFGATRHLHLGPGSYAAVLSPQHRLVVAASDASRQLQALPASGVDALLDRRMVQREESIGLSSSWNGSEMLSASHQVTTADWMVVAGMPRQNVTAPAVSLKRKVYLAAATTALGFMLLLYLVLRRELSPLTQATCSMLAMTRGRKAFAPLPQLGGGEIGALIASFNALVGERARVEEALRHSEERFHTLFDQAPVGLAVNDSKNERFLQANAAYARLLGRAQDELPQLEAQDLTHPDDQAASSRYFEALRSGNHDQPPLEKRYLRADGSAVWTRITVLPLQIEGGTTRSNITVALDIDAAKRNEELLKTSERAWRTLALAAPAGIFRTNAEGGNIFVSEAWTRITGISREQGLGYGWLRCIHPDDAPAIEREAYGGTLPDHTRLEYRILRPDGEVRWVIGEGQAEYDESGAVAGYVGTLTDISELKRVQQELVDFNIRLEQLVQERTRELTATNATLDKEVAERWRAHSEAITFARQLRELTQRFVAVEENEKRRLAREMHDRVSSSLMAVGLTIGLLRKDLQKRDDAAVKARLDDMAELIKDTMLSAREISSELRPAALEYDGLGGVVGDYAQKFAERTGIAVDVSCADRSLRLTPERETAMFRIFQEALMNCAKHAKASRVQVDFRAEGQHVRLTVSDDGVGFDVAAPLGATGGIGLLSMRERAEFAGGHLRVESEPQRGTRIMVEL